MRVGVHGEHMSGRKSWCTSMIKISNSNENEMVDLQAGYGHVVRADTLGVWMRGITCACGGVACRCECVACDADG